MSAIAHGWEPPAGSKVGKIPVGVAKEFHSADKKVGKWEHPVKRAAGGHSDVKEDRELVREMVKPTSLKKAKGGHVKCSTPQPW